MVLQVIATSGSKLKMKLFSSLIATKQALKCKKCRIISSYFIHFKQQQEKIHFSLVFLFVKQAKVILIITTKHL